MLLCQKVSDDTTLPIDIILSTTVVVVVTISVPSGRFWSVDYVGVSGGVAQQQRSKKNRVSFRFLSVHYVYRFVVDFRL